MQADPAQALSCKIANLLHGKIQKPETIKKTNIQMVLQLCPAWISNGCLQNDSVGRPIEETLK